MSVLTFTSNQRASIGVEIELQLIDADTFDLSNSIHQLLTRLPPGLDTQVKPELMQSYVEINTGVCQTVGEVREDLTRVLAGLKQAADSMGIRLLWSATHPFASWRVQQVTENERYHKLVELMQDVARRLVTFGLHVHVGVESGDKAVMVCDRMLRHLPLLLALSANSPFWEGRPTGLHSNRSMIMEGLPTAGLPRPMRNWSEYTWLINHLVATGFINTIREIWWDIRPHNQFGTVEIRVCDIPKNLDDVLALTALIQTLVVAISEEIDEGTYQSEYHPMMVQQNKWRAARYGAGAKLVNSTDYKQYTVAETVDQLVERLLPTAEKLGCVNELESARQLPHATGAEQQLEIYDRGYSRRTVVKEMLDRHEWQPQ